MNDRPRETSSAVPNASMGAHASDATWSGLRAAAAALDGVPRTTVPDTDGYVPCACRDCMEIAIGKPGKAVCHECEEADCDIVEECEAPHAYCSGGDEVMVDGKPYCSVCGQEF